MTEPTKREKRAALTKARAELAVEASQMQEARLEAMLLSETAQEMRATVRRLMDSWLSGQKGDSPPAGLVESVVALHAYLGLRSSISARDSELFHEFRQGRAAMALLSWSLSLARDSDDDLRVDLVVRSAPDSHGLRKVVRGHGVSVLVASGSLFHALAAFHHLSIPWRAWLELRLRALAPGERLVLGQRLAAANGLNLQNYVDLPPRLASLQFLQWLATWDSALEPEGLVPAGLPEGVLRLVALRVEVVGAAQDFVGALAEAKARGLVAQRSRTVSLADRLTPPVGHAAEACLRVGPAGEEPRAGTLWKETCEVSIGVNEYKTVFFTTAGERFDLGEGNWRWLLQSPPVIGVLAGWGEEEPGSSHLILQDEAGKSFTVPSRAVGVIKPAV